MSSTRRASADGIDFVVESKLVAGRPDPIDVLQIYSNRYVCPSVKPHYQVASHTHERKFNIPIANTRTNDDVPSYHPVQKYFHVVDST